MERTLTSGECENLTIQRGLIGVASSGRNSKYIKIGLVLTIILAVASIWFIKNNDKKVLTDQNQLLSDFSLHASSIDLEKLKSLGLPIIIDFGADSCIPCKKMAPILVELNKKYKGKVIIKFVDVWKYPEAAKGFPFKLIPTQFFFTSEGEPLLPETKLPFDVTAISRNEDGKHIFTVHQGGLTKEQFESAFEKMGMKK